MRADDCHGTVLLIDDRYAVDLSGLSPPEFSRPDVESEIASKLPFKFAYASAFDEAAKRYTVAEAVRAVEEVKPNGVLLDIMFGDSSERLGLPILAELTKRFPEIPVVVMTSVNKQEVWTECARLGAVDYINKPLDAALLWPTLDRYVGKDLQMKHWLVGQSPQFVQAVKLAALAARGGRIPVMITGETGCGKELLAHFIHRHGTRALKCFEVVFLPNIPDEMQAAALSGYRKGAFTGADRDEPGRFVKADQGIVFLDEIGDIGSSAQTLLLRVVEDGVVQRLGDARSTTVDVQVVSATNKDLARLIKDGAFREDLWERLNGRTVVLPPLAQRREDIPMLVRHLLRCEAVQRKQAVPLLPSFLENQILEFPWNGNVRGLRNYVARVLDAVGGGMAAELAFVGELPPRNEGPSIVPALRPMPGTEGNDSGKPRSSNGPLGPSHIQRLRLEELGILHRALLGTRHPVKGTLDRASAAALLTGKAKCSTNVFDRWVKDVWDDLDDENRSVSAQRFPELLPVIEKLAKK